ncbi:ENDD1 protein, partial [Hylia prasina]|nr:ENDD1 protein [Hylia prasina]
MRGLLLLQVLASCLWLGHSEVVTSFAHCPDFFYGRTTPNEALNPQNPAWICQRYSNSYHYATLYDRDNRIPIYSAYKYQPGPGKRPHTWWFVEPQVINPTYLKCMATEESITRLYSITSQQIGQSQAINQDYKNLQGLDCGHLSPSDHQSGNSKWVTLTLTNIVPQNSTLNKGAWNDYETSTMAQQTQGCTTTYVIVGAVPGNNYISNKRVNVPSHIWSAACCQANNTMRTWAVIAVNNNNQVQNLTLAQLEDRLFQLYGKGKVSLFHSACP